MLHAFLFFSFAFVGSREELGYDLDNMSVFEHCAFEVMWADECIWVGFVRL